jgi:polar amino acid transport system substrate-binding protein
MKILHSVLLIFLVLLTLESIQSQEKKLLISGPSGLLMNNTSTNLKNAYKNIGYTVEFQFLPAKRSIEMSNLGKYDGEILRIAGMERTYPNLIPVPVEIHTFKTAAVAEAGSRISQWNDLKKYTIGIRRGIKIMDENTSDMNRFIADDINQLERWLLNGRVDVILMSHENAERFIAKNRNSNYSEYIIHSQPGYHYLHSKNKNIVPIITKELQRMIDNGEWDKLVNAD